MKAIVIGATGTIGSAVADAFEQDGHEVVRISRHSSPSCDIEKPESIAALFESIGKVDAVICCAGGGAFKALSDLDDADLDYSVRSKLLGQVNLVRLGHPHLSGGGVFVLTSGVFSRNPPPGVPALAMANGGIESFTRAAALDLPRDIRINTVSPPFITETAEKMGMSTDGTLPAADNAQAYLRLATGAETGQVVFSGD